MKSSGNTIPDDGDFLSNGDIVWLHSCPTALGAEEHGLDGSLVRTLNGAGGGTDQHDLRLLPNGDYLVGRTFPRYGVDISACGGSTSGRLDDLQLQEITPSGSLVWSWLASDHIPLSEVAPQWRSTCKAGGVGDVYHWNSVEVDGDGYVLSFRHLDAVYRIDRTTGAIDWKLGGTPRPESLTVLGDPYSATSTFCGQHDARILPDGSLTIFHNGSGCNRAPRAERFTIDSTARTATLVESVTHAFLPYSGCCGSARKLPGGDWVVSWGGTRYVSEQKPSGAIIFQLVFTQGLSSYRASPVLPGVVSAAMLRAGMDAQYPR